MAVFTKQNAKLIKISLLQGEYRRMLNFNIIQTQGITHLYCVIK